MMAVYGGKEQDGWQALCRNFGNDRVPILIGNELGLKKNEFWRQKILQY